MIVFRADLSSLRRCAYLASLLKKKFGVELRCNESRPAAKFLTEKRIPFSMARDPAAIDLAKAGALVFDLPVFSNQDIALLAQAKKAGIATVQIVGPGGERQPADTVVVAAGKEALLHHRCRHFHKAKRKYRKKIKHVFVNLGDTLPYRDLRGIVDVLHRLRFMVKISPGWDMKKADKRNLMKIYPGIHFCGKSESPARAYFEADLALIPPGEEALEAACVGTPALYLPLNKGDEASALAWADRGTGVMLAPLPDFSLQSLRAAIAPLDLEAREKMGAAGKALVDGLGVQRFLEIMKERGMIA